MDNFASYTHVLNVYYTLPYITLEVKHIKTLELTCCLFPFTVALKLQPVKALIKTLLTVAYRFRPVKAFQMATKYVLLVAASVLCFGGTG